MTREQIMALEGRKLDAAVAEHVMDLVVRRVTSDQYAVWIPSERHYAYAGELYSFRPGEGPWFVPRYSTDIAAAWMVVERLPWPVALTNVVDGEWECTVLCYDGGETHDNDETATARTAPEAICRAALLAHFTDVRLRKNGGGAP